MVGAGVRGEAAACPPLRDPGLSHQLHCPPLQVGSCLLPARGGPQLAVQRASSHRQKCPSAQLHPVGARQLSLAQSQALQGRAGSPQNTPLGTLSCSVRTCPVLLTCLHPSRGQRVPIWEAPPPSAPQSVLVHGEMPAAMQGQLKYTIQPTSMIQHGTRGQTVVSTMFYHVPGAELDVSQVLSH